MAKSTKNIPAPTPKKGWGIVTPEGMNTNALRFFDPSMASTLYFHNANRVINETHVRDLMREIKKDGENLMPVLVDSKTMLIADGQHRFEAYKRLWANGFDGRMKVLFHDFETEENFLETLYRLQKSKKWAVTDFARMHTTTGHTAISMLTEFCANHPMLYDSKHNKPKFRKTGLLLFGKNVEPKIKKGAFTVSKGDLEIGDVLYSEVAQIFEILGVKDGTWTEQLFEAWHDIRFDEDSEKCINTFGIKAVLDEIMQSEKYNERELNAAMKRDDWLKFFARIITRVNMRD